MMAADTPTVTKGPLSDEELIEAWRAHRALVSSDKKYLQDIVQFDKFRLDAAEPPSNARRLDLFLFRHMAQDLVRTLANELNEWRHRLVRLSCWAEVLDRYDETGRMDLLWEFVAPLTECSLHAPYSIKQRLIYASCRVLERSARHRDTPETPEHEMGWDRLKALATDSAYTERMMSAIGQLDSRPFQKATGNYRHRATHRRLPGLDLEIYQEWHRTAEADGTATHSMNVAFPIALRAVVQPLLDEHRRVMSAFERLWDLIREVEKELAITP